MRERGQERVNHAQCSCNKHKRGGRKRGRRIGGQNTNDRAYMKAISRYGNLNLCAYAYLRAYLCVCLRACLHQRLQRKPCVHLSSGIERPRANQEDTTPNPKP